MDIPNPSNKSLQDKIQSSLRNLYVDLPSTVLSKLSVSLNSNLYKALQPLVDQFNENLTRYEEISEEISEPLKNSGFWIPPCVSENFILNLRELCVSENNSPNNIRNYFISKFHDNDFNLLRWAVNSWSDNKFFYDRMSIIENALKAHISEDYVLSIPTLLPAIEGVLNEIAGIRRGNSKISELAKEIFSDDYYEGMRAASKDIIIEFISGSEFYGSIPNEFFTLEEFPRWVKKNGYTETQILNRHAILHGIHINYASVENSLRAFLLLDALSFVEPIGSIV